jgi:hypothetical protein
MKIYTYPNFVGVLPFNMYNVENPLRVSARSNESCIEYSFHLLLDPIVNNMIKPSSRVLVRSETRFDREPVFY